MARQPVHRCRYALSLLALPAAIIIPLGLALLYRRPMLEPALLLLVFTLTCARFRRRVGGPAVRPRTDRAGITSPSRLDEASLVGRLSRLCGQDRSQARLARLVAHLCRRAGLPRTTTAQFAAASALHRLGQVFLPGSADRNAETRLAARLLADGGPLAACARDMACFHQQRWDGQLSVDGLDRHAAGDAIPFPARLLSVALAFDRALPDHLPPDASLVMPAICNALDLVLAESGHALDPTLTALLLDRSEALVQAVQPDVRLSQLPASIPTNVSCFSLA